MTAISALGVTAPPQMTNIALTMAASLWFSLLCRAEYSIDAYTAVNWIHFIFYAPSTLSGRKSWMVRDNGNYLCCLKAG